MRLILNAIAGLAAASISCIASPSHPSDTSAVLLDSLLVTATVTVVDSSGSDVDLELPPAVSKTRVREIIWVWARSGGIDLVGDHTTLQSATQSGGARPTIAQMISTLGDTAVVAAITAGYPSSTSQEIAVLHVSWLAPTTTSDTTAYTACSGSPATMRVRTYDVVALTPASASLVSATTCGLATPPNGCSCTSDD